MFQLSRSQEKKRSKNTRNFLNVKKVSLIFLLILSGFLIFWVYNKLTSPIRFPITKVEVVDPAQHIPEETIKSIVLPFVQEGFFNVSVKDIRRHLQALPWISQVVVSRRWPSTVIIQIDERQPVARWNDKGILVSSGGVFYPEDGYIPPNLPLLKGPEGEELALLTNYTNFQAQLTTAGLTIKELDESNRDALDMVLTNGIHIILGKTDALARLQRFVDVYTEVFAGRESKVDYVDMRYNNGMAVKWR